MWRRGDEVFAEVALPSTAEVAGLSAAGVRGLIVVPAAAGEPFAPREEPGAPPIVFAGEFSPSSEFPGHYIAVDSYSGFYNAVMRLNRFGHELIGYIGASVKRETEPGYLACRDAMAGRRRAAIVARQG